MNRSGSAFSQNDADTYQCETDRGRTLNSESFRDQAIRPPTSELRIQCGGAARFTRPCKGCHAERSRGISGYFAAAQITVSNVERPTRNTQRPMKMPAEGLEPTRPCGHWILSPARLPIPPRRLGKEQDDTIFEWKLNSATNWSRFATRSANQLTGIKYDFVVAMWKATIQNVAIKRVESDGIVLKSKSNHGII